MSGSVDLSIIIVAWNARELERCVRYLDENPDVGVVGPQLLSPDRTKQNGIHNFSSWKTPIGVI